jgi:glycerol kinase
MAADERDRRYRKWKKAVQRTMAWLDADDEG